MCLINTEIYGWFVNRFSTKTQITTRTDMQRGNHNRQDQRF